jgi:hypothetical protein
MFLKHISLFTFSLLFTISPIYVMAQQAKAAAKGAYKATITSNASPTFNQTFINPARQIQNNNMGAEEITFTGTFTATASGNNDDELNHHLARASLDTILADLERHPGARLIEWQVMEESRGPIFNT